MRIRRYTPEDYSQLVALYRDSALYGGQFDPDRDAEERLRRRIEGDADAILVAEHDRMIVGTVSLIEDDRVAWLFRFAVMGGTGEAQVAGALYDASVEVLRKRGHRQVLVYSPAGDARLNRRYSQLGFRQGGDFTCFWKDIA